MGLLPAMPKKRKAEKEKTAPPPYEVRAARSAPARRVRGQRPCSSLVRRARSVRGDPSPDARAVTLACGRAGVRAGGQGETVGRRARWICAAGAVGALIGAALGAIVGWTVALSDTRVRACTLRPTGLAATARER